MMQAWKTLSVPLLVIVLCTSRSPAWAVDIDMLCAALADGAASAATVQTDCAVRNGARHDADRICNDTSCVTALAYNGKLEFTSGDVRLSCVKDTDAFNGWPGHLCTLTGAGPKPLTIGHLCGSRDCQWQSAAEGVSVYGSSAPAMEDFMPADTVLVKTPKY